MAFRFIKMLRRLPVKEDVKDIATFVNRELLPAVQELADGVQGGGMDGATGATGADGATGATGADGAPGTPGNTGLGTSLFPLLVPGEAPEEPGTFLVGQRGATGATGSGSDLFPLMLPAEPAEEAGTFLVGQAGPQGIQGASAFPVFPPDLVSEEPGTFLVGQQGAAGATGATGSGSDLFPLCLPTDAAEEPGTFLVGQPGANGAAGAQGPAGPSAFPVFPPDLTSDEPIPFYIPGANLSGLPVIQPGSFIGLQITAAGAATAIEITGANAGENIRFSTTTTEAGAGPFDNYALGTSATMVLFTAGGAISVTGLANGVAGREEVLLNGAGVGTVLTIADNSGSSAAANRIVGPGDFDIKLFARESIRARYEGTQWRALGRARSAVQAGGGTISPAETLNFVNSSITVAAGVAAITDQLLGTINTSSTSPFSLLNLTSTDSSIVITGLPSAGTFAPNFITNRGGQNAMDLGTSTVTTCSPADRGYRPGLTGITTVPTATASTANLSTGVYTMPANTVVTGTRYELFMAWVYAHTAATTPTLTYEFLLQGSVIASATFTITPIATASTYTGTFRTYFRCITNGTTGTFMVTVLHLDNVQTFGLNSDSNSTNVTALTGLNTTLTQTLEARIRMNSTTPAGNTLSVTEAFISRII